MASEFTASRIHVAIQPAGRTFLLVFERAGEAPLRIEMPGSEAVSLLEALHDLLAAHPELAEWKAPLS